MTQIYRDPKTGRFTKVNPNSNAFDLTEFVHGRKAVSKIGNTVRFKAFDNNNRDVMLVSISSKLGSPQIHKMLLSGKIFKHTDSVWDIVSIAV